MKKKREDNYAERVFVISEGCECEQTEEGKTVMKVKKPGILQRLAGRIRPGCRNVYIDLDRFGGEVIRLLDGRRTVYQVAQEMENLFQEEEYMMQRTVTFLVILEKRGLISRKGVG